MASFDPSDLAASEFLKAAFERRKSPRYPKPVYRPGRYPLRR